MGLICKHIPFAIDSDSETKGVSNKQKQGRGLASANVHVTHVTGSPSLRKVLTLSTRRTLQDEMSEVTASGLEFSRHGAGPFVAQTPQSSGSFCWIQCLEQPNNLIHILLHHPLSSLLLTRMF